jgi:hypothetical protein
VSHKGASFPHDRGRDAGRGWPGRATVAAFRGSGTHLSTDGCPRQGDACPLRGPGVIVARWTVRAHSGTTTSVPNVTRGRSCHRAVGRFPPDTRPAGTGCHPPAPVLVAIEWLAGCVSGSGHPLLDRYAHRWMWLHGGWDVDPPDELDPAAAERLVWSTPPPRRRPPRRRFMRRIPGEPPRIVSFVIGLVDPAFRYMEQRHPGLRGRAGEAGGRAGSKTPQRVRARRATSGRRASMRCGRVMNGASG